MGTVERDHGARRRMSHPRKYNILSNGHTREHRSLVIQLGIFITIKNPIHHRDGNGHNNAHNNLIICESDAYHNLIEAREKAYRATGDPNKRRCAICKEWDLIENMRHRTRRRKSAGQGFYEHRKCHAQRERSYRMRNHR